ncbi:MAG: hypothetical protein QOI65_1317 [Thermoleophilaceae bacterium]|jgi:hypothetical protein|nr:hypothetical protein [Thermoleophilaceae bacterium]
MRRAVVTMGAAIALTGCGGADNSSKDVRTTATTYMRAFAAGDPAKACSLLTPPARARFVARVRAVAPAADCPGAVRQIRRAAGPVALAALRATSVSDVRVNGSRATAKLTSGSGSQIAQLQRTAGDWRITAAPGTQ